MTSSFHHQESAAVYLHFPCFDGIVSAALTILFLSEMCNWRFESVNAVNYDIQSEWLNICLPPHSCVVDFLYHPQAEFWCDHHTTAFLNSDLWADFAARRKPLQFYDQNSRSSARLLWCQKTAVLGQSGRLEEMVDWADKIDTADYDDVNQALFGSHSALQINRSLAVEADSAYCDLLVRTLCLSSLADLAAHPEVQRRLTRVDELNKKGLSRVARKIHLHGNIAAFDVLTEEALVNRYSAFYFHPSVQYSIGTFRSNDSIIVRASANPWLHFDSPNLGEMMRAAAAAAGLPSAGGGHERVGSLRMGRDSQRTASEVVAYLIKKLHDHAELAEKHPWPKAVMR